MKKRTRKRVAPVSDSRPAEQKPAPARFSWRPHAWRILAIWVVALAAYSNSFRSGLVLDNAIIIGQDTRIRAFTPENVHLILTEELWYKSSTTGLYRPLTTFSYLVNYALFHNGTSPLGYHLVNLALHFVNVLLVYLLGLLLLEHTVLAWALAGLWSVHPILTESVTNIVGRADLLAGFGVLAGLFCHVQASRTAGRRQLGWITGLAVAALIGIFSKESAAVLPGIMLLYDLTWGRSARARSAWTRYAAVILPFAVFFKLRADVIAHESVGFVPFLDNPLMGADFWTARLTAVKVIGNYLWLVLWPNRLSADYSYNAVPLFGWRLDRPQDIAALLALAACGMALIIAFRSYRTRKPIFFFVLFFFITLAPVGNIFILIGTIMAERFLYLPSIGLVGCLVMVGYWSARRVPARAAWAIVVLVCGALAIRTFIRNRDWLNERSLGASAAAAAPQSFKAHHLLASALLDANPPELDAAVREVQRMLDILNGLPDADLLGRPYEVAGRVFREKGDQLTGNQRSFGTDGASDWWYRKALTVLLKGTQAERAQNDEIRRVNREHGKTVAPAGWAPLYLELGRVYGRMGEPQKALEPLTYGRLMRPDDDFSEEMSRARLSMGDPSQAAVALMEGLVLNPNSARLPADLVELYRRTAADSCAIRSSGAVSLNLECPLVHGQLCSASRNVAAAYAQNGQRAKAASIARTAVQQLGCPTQLFQ